tara:strand:- start:435 stop:980 length:546 start_codon:yes stop_codon:yes gene_type:complete
MKYRNQLIHFLFNWTQTKYTRFKKKKPWGISTSNLLDMPKNSFGYRLGDFLQINNFELLPKVERHDAYHVLCGYSTNVEDEIALQYVCFGNGKRSPYLVGVLLIGTILLPEYLNYYRESFKVGKQANPFHHYDFKTLLHANFNTLRSSIFSDKLLTRIKELQKTNTYNNKTTQLWNRKEVK